MDKPALDHTATHCFALIAKLKSEFDPPRALWSFLYARGVQTLLTYGSVAGVSDLYPTQVQTAFGTSLQRTETREYDFYTGVVTRATDADNNVSASTTYDIFGRPTLVKAASIKVITGCWRLTIPTTR